MKDTFNDAEDGVSEILGEMLMLAITVMIVVVLIASVSSMMSRPATQIVSMTVQPYNSTAIVVQHTGGDAIVFADLAVAVDGNSKPFQPADTNSNSLWDAGEYLYVPGVAAANGSVLVYNPRTHAVLGNFMQGV
jgi:FlaG/FlaF family flagellin (archaellin)